jgi:ATP-binding cassette subfamily B (MDR/TAP) protein 1
MFSFADGYDMFLIATGTLGAIITGGVMPFFSILMGEIMDGFNGDSREFKSKISWLCLILVFGGCVNFVTGFLQVSARFTFFAIVGLLSLIIFPLLWFQVFCWNKAGERQTQKIRVAYVKAIISQDIAWFDANNPATLATKVAVLVNKVSR